MMKLTRIKSIRARCVDCADGEDDIKNCPHKDCNLFLFRDGKKSDRGITPDFAIRKYCLWCGNGQAAEVKACDDKTCALHVYRTLAVLPIGNDKNTLNARFDASQHELTFDSSEILKVF